MNTVIKIQKVDIPKVLFTSDWHFYHKNIIKYSNRPFKDLDEMHETIINNTAQELLKINGQGGILFNLGDVVFCRKNKAMDILVNEIEKPLQNKGNFTGKFIYCIGNHDVNNIMTADVKLASMELSYLVEIYDGTKCMLRFTLNHQPLKEYTGSFNLHGHYHTPPLFKNRLTHEQRLALIAENLNKDRPNPDFNNMLNYSQSNDHFDVGIDFNDYKPVWLKDILDGKLGINPVVFNNIKFN